MILKILFVITIILQFFAVGVAVKLTPRYQIQCIVDVADYWLYSDGHHASVRISAPTSATSNFGDYREIYVWGGVITSLAFAIGVFLIHAHFSNI